MGRCGCVQRIHHPSCSSALDTLGKERALRMILGFAASENFDPDVIEMIALKCPDISAFGLEDSPALHLGAQKGHIGAVHKLLALGARVDVKNAEGSTALHLAVESGQKEIVEVLMFARADLEEIDRVGRTALHNACEYARENDQDNDLALILLQRGANVHSSDKYGYTPVISAMENPPLMKLVIEYGVKPSVEQASNYANQCKGVERREEVFELLVTNGWGPRVQDGSNDNPDREATVAAALAARGGLVLHKAVCGGDADALVELLSWGKDPNVMDSSGRTPLHLAAFAGSVVMVEALLDAGSAFNVKSRPHDWTPLHVAAKQGNTKVTETLLAALASFKIAASKSVTNVVEADWTCQLEEQDAMGRRPLHLAASSGNVEVVEALLRTKVTVNACDMSSHTPLYTAVISNKAEAVTALLHGGACPDTKDSDGTSALNTAVRRGYDAVVEALIAGGASVDAGGKKGDTPLHMASKFSPPSTVAILLRAGALPGHCWNDLLRSPLMVACSAGNLGAVRQLLPRLSVRQINMRDRVRNAEEGGDTALLTAIESAPCNYNGIDVVQALLDAGADPTIRAGSSNKSPLDKVLLNQRIAADFALGPRLVRALVDAGADADEVGPKGFTALHLACFHGACGDVIRVLLNAGADARAPCAGFHFWTPLQLTAFGGNPGALRVMIGLPECGGLNAVGAPPERATTLAYAVHHGKAESVRFLLEEGADMDLLPLGDDGIVTRRTESLIHTAIAQGHGDTLALLLQAKQFKEESERQGGAAANAP